MLGTDDTAAANADTSLLYAGEQFDTAAQMYYNRARYYDTNTGRFNRMDPFAGNNQDPQSLHRYNYTHSNPVNGIDPTGEMTIQEVSVTIGIALFVMAGIHLVAHQAKHHMKEELERITETDAITFLGPGLQEQMSREFLVTSDPEVLRFNMEWWHEKAELNKAVTYYNARTKKTLLEFIDTTYHGLQIAGIGLGLTGGIARSQIIWSKPHGGPGHWGAIKTNVTNRAVARKATKFYTNRSISTITGRAVESRLRPDWAEVLPSGKIRLFEVRGVGQSTKELMEKGKIYKQLLGNKLEHYQWLNIGEQVP